jgi:hypothetical protein
MVGAATFGRMDLAWLLVAVAFFAACAFFVARVADRL